MSKFEEANSVHTYIDPSYYKNSSKINTSYYNVRGIPKNISISKQQDFADLTVRHNKVPIVDFQSSKNENIYNAGMNQQNNMQTSNLYNSDVSTNKTNAFELEQLQQKNNQWLQQHRKEHDQLQESQRYMSEQIRSLSQDKDNLDKQIEELQKKLSITEKKIGLLINSDNKSQTNNYFEQINTIKEELQIKQNQNQQRQQSRDSVFEKKISLLADQIGNLEKNMKKNCNDCEKKDVTINCLKHHYDPYKYTHTHQYQETDNYFDIPETRYVTQYNYVQPRSHNTVRYSYTQPKVQSVTTYNYDYPQYSHTTERINYSPMKYKYSYTDSSTRYTSPYKHCTFSNSSRFLDNNKIKQVRYSSPSPIRRYSKHENMNQNFDQNTSQNKFNTQQSSRGQLLGETTTNRKVTYIQDTTDKISYRKLTPEIYEYENPEFTIVLKTSQDRNPHLVIRRDRQHNGQSITNNDNQISFCKKYNETQKTSNYQNNVEKQNGDVRIVRRTRSRSPVSRFIKQLTKLNYKIILIPYLVFHYYLLQHLQNITKILQNQFLIQDQIQQLCQTIGSYHINFVVNFDFLHIFPQKFFQDFLQVTQLLVRLRIVLHITLILLKINLDFVFKVQKKPIHTNFHKPKFFHFLFIHSMLQELPLLKYFCHLYLQVIQRGLKQVKTRILVNDFFHEHIIDQDLYLQIHISSFGNLYQIAYMLFQKSYLLLIITNNHSQKLVQENGQKYHPKQHTLNFLNLYNKTKPLLNLYLLEQLFQIHLLHLIFLSILL